MIMETRKCTVCGKEKPLSEMSKSYSTRCKECAIGVVKDEFTKATIVNSTNFLILDKEQF